MYQLTIINYDDIINDIHIYLIGTDKIKKLLGITGRIELLPQLFTELPYEYELHGFYVNINTTSIKSLDSLKGSNKIYLL